MFLNRGGQFQDQTESWGLGQHTGRWESLATGDFDGDGRLDFLVTNGDNDKLFMVFVAAVSTNSY